MKHTFTIFVFLYSFNLVSAQNYTLPDFFRKTRQLPLIKLNTTQTINVSAYGAVINDGIDDISGITNALNAAKAIASVNNPVKVLFEKGVYDLRPLSGSHSINITSMNYVEVEGNQAEIMIHNPQVGFLSLLRCNNVIVENLFVDYAKLPFTQGRVIAKNLSNSTFDLKIDSGFPLLSETYFTTAEEKWGVLKEQSGQLKAGVENLFPYRGWTQISPDTFRVTQPNSNYINQIAIGDYFVQIARTNGSTIFKSESGKNVTYLNNTSYASPAGTYNTFSHDEWNIINCKIIPKPGRVQSANADCIHISGGNIGPWVEGCVFDASTDDAVNMKYTNRDILSVQNTTMVTIKYFASVGDTICFYNPREGKLLGRVRINSVTNMGNNEFRISLSEPVQLTNISSHQSGDKAYIDTKAAESFVFKNNIIRNGRRYGILIQNCYGLIENNVFENLSSSGIKIYNAVDWSEGFTGHNIQINNNRFINCGFDTSFINDPFGASISTILNKLKSPCFDGMTWCGVEQTDWKGLKDISISGNYFLFNKAALNLNNIDGGFLERSQYVHNPNDITIPDGGSYNTTTINNTINFVNRESLSTNRITDDIEKDVKIYFLENNLNIHFLNNFTDLYVVEVFDNLGKKIRKQKFQSSMAEMNFLGMAKGMYIVVIRSEKNVISKKIIY